MRILISGAAGFLGSHLTDLLISRGHDVVGIDNLFTGRRENVAHLKGHPKFTLIEQDITTPITIDGPIDQIYHLASPTILSAYLQYRIATLRVNSVGTFNLLELALEKNARILTASTFDIYGDPAVSPQREDYLGYVNPTGLRSAYEESKRFAEACTMSYNRERGADTRIVRIFNTFGPRLDPYDGRVVTTFTRQALAGEPITVFGDGTQGRSLCYVSDMVEGLALAMDCDFYEPINLGNPEPVTVIQLAREILELVPESKSKITFLPSPEYDPKVRRPDITRARQILGWSPKVSRKEGLATLIRHFREIGTGQRDKGAGQK
jgi:nucleoside-diphosphate-sugar epimerase